MSKRLEQLDSLRGLAALSVVVGHCTNIITALTTSPALHWLMSSPLSIVRAGHEAVILFFMLSGFVLALPFYKGRVPYRQFLIKRVCRIYLPYLAAILFSAGMAVLCVHRRLPELGSWFQLTWTTPLTPKLLLAHALLIGSFDTATLNTAIWSLVHEMRISIIFPLVIWLVLRYSWQRCLLIGLLLSIASICLDKGITLLWHVTTNYPDTLHYGAFFIIGALLAKHRALLTARVAALSALARYGLLLAGILCYTYEFWFLPGRTDIFHKYLIMDWITAVGSSIFILLSLASMKVTNLLTSRPILHLGVTSYSIYLLHGTLLFALVYLCYGTLPLWSITLLTIAGTILLATLSYRWIEAPAIKLGRHLTAAAPAAAAVSEQQVI